MKLVELLNKVNEAYDDGFLREYYDEVTGGQRNGSGDYLALHIVREIQETFDPDASDEAQISEAIRVLESSRQQLDKVIYRIGELAS